MKTRHEKGTTYRPTNKQNIGTGYDTEDEGYVSMSEEESPDSQEINQDRVSTNTVHLEKGKNDAKTKTRNKGRKPINVSIPTIPDAATQTKHNPILALQNKINEIAQESPILTQYKVTEHAYASEYIKGVLNNPETPIENSMIINAFFQLQQQIEESSRLEGELYNLKTQAETIDAKHRYDKTHTKMLPKIQDALNAFHKELGDITPTITLESTDQISSINKEIHKKVTEISASLAKELKAPKQDDVKTQTKQRTTNKKRKSTTQHKEQRPKKKAKTKDLWISVKPDELSSDTASVVGDHEALKQQEPIKSDNLPDKDQGFNFRWMDSDNTKIKKQPSFSLWQAITNLFISLFSPLFSKNNPIIPDNNIHNQYDQLTKNAKLPEHDKHKDVKISSMNNRTETADKGLSTFRDGPVSTKLTQSTHTPAAQQEQYLKKI